MTNDTINIAFSGGLFNRASAQRTDPNWVKDRLDRADNRFVLIVNDDIVIATDMGGPDCEVLWAKTQELAKVGFDANRAVLLGIDGDDVAYWGLSISEDELAAYKQTLGVPGSPFPLRSLASLGHLSDRMLAIASHAKALTNWHDNHLFCSTCGAKTVLVEAGAKRVCRACDTDHFPRVNPVAIMLVYSGDKCLLGRQSRFPPGVYTALAGFVEPGETIEEAVRRETFEESGIRVGKVTYITSQPWPFLSNLMIGCHAEAISTELDPDFDELEDVRWFERVEVEQMIAGSHPDGLQPPTRIAIANHLMLSFLDGLD
jgi:NAD+ diphosphatase